MSRKLFKIKRKGYDTDEADAYITALENRANLLQEELGYARAAVSARDAELNELRGQRELISKTIISATEKAEQMRRLSEERYKSEIDELKAFHERWLSFYSTVITKFSPSGAVDELKLFNQSMEGILQGEDALYIFSEAQEQFERESRRLSESEKGRAKGNAYGDDTQQAERGAKKSKDFNPEEQIRKFLDKQVKDKPQSKGNSVAPAVSGGKSMPGNATGNAASKGGLAGKGGKSSNETAASEPLKFSFEEALNPVQPLEEILRELGVK